MSTKGHWQRPEAYGLSGINKAIVEANIAANYEKDPEKRAYLSKVRDDLYEERRDILLNKKTLGDVNDSDK